MLKRILVSALTFTLMFSIVSCSSKNKNTSIDVESGVALLTELLTAFQEQDIEKIASISTDRSFETTKEFKEHIKGVMKDSNEKIKNFKVLDKNEVNSEYLALYAKIEWESGDSEEIKFKIMPKDGNLTVYLKEFVDGETRVDDNEK